jgi:hypothetical protein
LDVCVCWQAVSNTDTDITAIYDLCFIALFFLLISFDLWPWLNDNAQRAPCCQSALFGPFPTHLRFGNIPPLTHRLAGRADGATENSPAIYGWVERHTK